MFLRKKFNDSDLLIRAGMLSLIVALFAQLFIHPPGDFWQGFVAGISGVLIGLSIVLNLRGLTLWRRERGSGA